MRRIERRRKPLGEDDVLRAVVCDYVGPAECAINAEAGYTTAVASRAGLVARHTGPQREGAALPLPAESPRRAHRGMRDVTCSKFSDFGTPRSKCRAFGTPQPYWDPSRATTRACTRGDPSRSGMATRTGRAQRRSAQPQHVFFFFSFFFFAATL